MRALRRAKGESHLLIALADLAGLFDVAADDRGADALCRRGRRRAIAIPVAPGARGGRLALDATPRHRSCLRFRRAGAGQARRGELNYSSDIDLIVLFDPEAARSPRRLARAAVRALRQALARLLQERTATATCSASICGCGPIRRDCRRDVVRQRGSYYETLGQNWERAAMIKARPVAGESARPALPGRSRAVHLAQVFRLRGHRRHPRDEAADPRRARPRAGDGRRPRRQARPRRHPRDRVLRPDAAAHLRRPAAVDARRAHARHAAPIARRSTGSAPTRSTICPRLFLPARGRASAADDRRRADAAPALRAGRRSPVSPSSAATRARGVRARPHRTSAPVEKHYARLFEDAPTLGAERQSGVHRRRRRSRDADDVAPARLPAARRGGRDDPRLAFRPPLGGAQRPRARSADRTDARPARRLLRLGRRRRGARRVRRGAGAHAGARWSCCRSCAPTRRCANCSATSSAARRASPRSSSAPARARRGYRSRPRRRARRQPRRRRHDGAGRGVLAAAGDFEECSTARATSPPRKCSSSACACSPAPSTPSGRGAPTARSRGRWSRRC